MLKIRHGVFETNSSSVHNMIMCSDEEYKNFIEDADCLPDDDKDLEKYMDRLLVEYWSDNIITLKDAIRKYNTSKYVKEPVNVYGLSIKEILEVLEEENIASTLDNWLIQHEYYESFHEKYTTPGGEVVHAIGYYGNDY